MKLDKFIKKITKNLQLGCFLELMITGVGYKC